MTKNRSANKKQDQRPTVTATPELVAGTTPRRDLTLLYLLIAVAMFHFITMPRFFYPGDNFATRAETAHLVQSGQLGIPYSMKQAFGGLLENKGQYLYENDARQLLFSKYGIANTCLYALPYLAEKAYSGQVDFLRATPSLLFFINLLQIVLTLIATVYLFKTAALYTSRRWLRVVFVLLLFYTTFVWHYLRAPTHEIYQMVAMAGFFYHTVRFLRGAASGTAGSRPWGQLAAATCWGGFLVLLKFFFILNMAALAVFAATAGPVSMGLFTRIKENVGRHLPRYLLYCALPAAVAAAILLTTNAYKFGSPLDNGYQQWLNKEGLAVDRLTLASIPRALWWFFFDLTHKIDTDHANVFINCPIFAFGLFGLVRFARRHRPDCILLAGIFVVNLLGACAYNGFTGGWCSGPRYLVPILIVSSLPFIFVMESVIAWKNRLAKLAAMVAMCLALGWSALLQFDLNSIHYFAWYYTTGVFAQFKQPAIEGYFRSVEIHRGLLAQDLLAHRRGQKQFPPLQIMEPLIPPNQRDGYLRLDGFVRQQAELNFFFFE